MVLKTTAELVVAAFIVWRVFGLTATLIALGWQAYRERRAARWRNAFAEMEWPRLVVERLLAGDGHAKRRVSSDVRAAGHRQVAANLGISVPWLRALMRDPSPSPVPRPQRGAFDPLRVTIPIFISAPRSPFGIGWEV